MEAVVGFPYMAKVMLNVIYGDGVLEQEGVKDLRGKVGKEAGLGRGIDGEGGVEK